MPYLLDLPPKYVTDSHIFESQRTYMQDGQQLVILGEVVLCQNGPLRRLRRYVKGKHPHLGPMQIGWSGGWETIWEVDSFMPQHHWQVKEEAQCNTFSEH